VDDGTKVQQKIEDTERGGGEFRMACVFLTSSAENKCLFVWKIKFLFLSLQTKMIITNNIIV
jgi:hypothetical protein